MKKKNEGKHIMPAVIECDLKTGESRVLKYVELTDEEFDKQIIKPLAKEFYELLVRDIASGKFDEIMKEHNQQK